MVIFPENWEHQRFYELQSFLASLRDTLTEERLPKDVSIVCFPHGVELATICFAKEATLALKQAKLNGENNGQD